MNNLILRLSGGEYAWSTHVPIHVRMVQNHGLKFLGSIIKLCQHQNEIAAGVRLLVWVYLTRWLRWEMGESGKEDNDDENTGMLS